MTLTKRSITIALTAIAVFALLWALSFIPAHHSGSYDGWFFPIDGGDPEPASVEFSVRYADGTHRISGWVQVTHGGATCRYDLRDLFGNVYPYPFSDENPFSLPHTVSVDSIPTQGEDYEKHAAACRLPRFAAGPDFELIALLRPAFGGDGGYVFCSDGFDRTQLVCFIKFFGFADYTDPMYDVLKRLEVTP